MIAIAYKTKSPVLDYYRAGTQILNEKSQYADTNTTELVNKEPYLLQISGF